MPRPKKYVPLRRNDRNSVGATIKGLRQEQELTQQDLAGRLAVVGWDVSRDTVQNIESGEREVTDIDLRFLAKGLRVPIQDIFADPPKATSRPTPRRRR